MAEAVDAFAQMIARGIAIQAERRQKERWARVRAEHEARLRAIFGHMSRDEVRALWDRYDGINAPEDYAGEDIHGYLHLIGDGRYCAV